MTFTEFMDAFAKFGIGEKRIKYVLSMWPDSHNTWEGLKIELMDMWESMQPTLSATEIRQMWRLTDLA